MTKFLNGYFCLLIHQLHKHSHHYNTTIIIAVLYHLFHYYQSYNSSPIKAFSNNIILTKSSFPFYYFYCLQASLLAYGHCSSLKNSCCPQWQFSNSHFSSDNIIYFYDFFCQLYSVLNKHQIYVTSIMISDLYLAAHLAFCILVFCFRITSKTCSKLPYSSLTIFLLICVHNYFSSTDKNQAFALVRIKSSMLHMLDN